jgi:hypothetical protein
MKLLHRSVARKIFKSNRPFPSQAMKKMIRFSLVAAYVAVFAAVAAPLASAASDPLFVQSAISAAPFNDRLLAQAAAASSKAFGMLNDSARAISVS